MTEEVSIDTGVPEINQVYHAVLEEKKTPPSQELYAYQKASQDYVTIKGLELRTGAKPDEFGVFVLRELVDNALDFMERHAQRGSKCSNATVMVQLVHSNGLYRLQVSNTNFGVPAFSKERLQRILDFTASYSSKKNKFQISRGALGDAFKSVVGIPYALAGRRSIDWSYPITIRSGYDVFEVTLSLSTITANITHLTTEKFNDYTEIEVCLPEADLKAMAQTLEGYAIVNTHISWNIEIHGYKPIKCPAIEEIKNEWKNPLSIHCYDLAHFNQFILDLEDNDMLAYDVIRAFREGTNIKKDSALTVGMLKQSPAKRQVIYDELKKTFPPAEQVDTPFELKTKQRRIALTKRLNQLGYSISKLKYKCTRAQTGSYAFLFEIGIAELTDTCRSLIKYEYINSSPHYYYEPLASNNSYTYRWTKGKTHYASSVTEILRKYDYESDGMGKRPPSLIIANLVSPRIDYQSYGKSDINLQPFSKSIAETVVKTCGPRKRGYRYRDNKGRERTIHAKDVLIQILEDRLEKVTHNPELKIYDKWTQSTVYYAVRNWLKGHGMRVPDRDYLTNQIRVICKEKLGKRRDELGIFAADRAQLYFRGKYNDVGFDELDVLSKKGADIIICEKEGLVEVLAPYADKLGVALLNTRGFLVEYAMFLSHLGQKYGANIAIITDFDASGWYLALLVKNAIRIGINFNTLDYFQISHDDNVVEDYSPEGHLDQLRLRLNIRKLPNESRTFQEFQFIGGENPRRVQIDSVLQKVGAKMFWGYVVSELRRHFPSRNYNRSIETPAFSYPSSLQESKDKIESYFMGLCKPINEKIQTELQSVKELMDVEQKEKEIKERQIAVIEADDTSKGLIDGLKALTQSLKESDSDSAQ